MEVREIGRGGGGDDVGGMERGVGGRGRSGGGNGEMVGACDIVGGSGG